MTDKEIEQEIKYLKESCIEAGKELSKYSYAWDGKEKNLVVSVMKLNRMYEESKQQLHHKEQELESQLSLIDFYQQKIEVLQAENEELKEKLSTYKKMLDNPEVRVALTDVRTGERDIWRKLGNKANRYKQALEKIEEIAEASNNPPCLEFDCDCTQCEDETTDNGDTCMQYGLEKILAIINEVKDE